MTFTKSNLKMSKPAQLGVAEPNETRFAKNKPKNMTGITCECMIALHQLRIINSNVFSYAIKFQY